MLSAIIGAGANIVGGLLGSRDKAKDRALQKQFAQEGIQWKVKDAEKAGIHPLYALGAQTHSFAPVSVGGPDLATGIAGAGQDISRAVAAGSSEATRRGAFASAVEKLTVEKMGLENQLLGAQIAKLSSAQVPPAIPAVDQRYLIEGQAPMGLVETEAMRRTASAPDALHQEPAAIPDVGFARTSTGGYAPVYSQDVKQRLEEDTPGMLLWNFRNRLVPNVYPSPPGFETPGYHWQWDPVLFEYRQVKSRLPIGFDPRGVEWE